MQKLALAVAHTLEHRARSVLGHVDHKFFHWLAPYAVYFLIHYAGRGNLKFVALPAHILYQYRKVHFAPTAHAVAVRRIRFFNPQRHVAQKFLEQPVPYVAGGYPLSVLARKRRVVDGESHFDGGLGYLYELVRLYAVGRTDRIAYIYLFKTRETDYIARLGAFARDAL